MGRKCHSIFTDRNRRAQPPARNHPPQPQPGTAHAQPPARNHPPEATSPERITHPSPRNRIPQPPARNHYPPPQPPARNRPRPATGPESPTPATRTESPSPSAESPPQPPAWGPGGLGLPGNIAGNGETGRRP